MEFNSYYNKVIKEVFGYKHATKEFVKKMFDTNQPIETAVGSIEFLEPWFSEKNIPKRKTPLNK